MGEIQWSVDNKHPVTVPAASQNCHLSETILRRAMFVATICHPRRTASPQKLAQGISKFLKSDLEQKEERK